MIIMSKSVISRKLPVYLQFRQIIRLLLLLLLLLFTITTSIITIIIIVVINTVTIIMENFIYDHRILQNCRNGHG